MVAPIQCSRARIEQLPPRLGEAGSGTRARSQWPRRWFGCPTAPDGNLWSNGRRSSQERKRVTLHLQMTCRTDPSIAINPS